MNKRAVGKGLVVTIGTALFRRYLRGQGHDVPTPEDGLHRHTDKLLDVLAPVAKRVHGAVAPHAKDELNSLGGQFKKSFDPEGKGLFQAAKDAFNEGRKGGER